MMRAERTMIEKMLCPHVFREIEHDVMHRALSKGIAKDNDEFFEDASLSNLWIGTIIEDIDYVEERNGWVYEMHLSEDLIHYLKNEEDDYGVFAGMLHFYVSYELYKYLRENKLTKYLDYIVRDIAVYDVDTDANTFFSFEHGYLKDWGKRYYEYQPLSAFIEH